MIFATHTPRRLLVSLASALLIVPTLSLHSQTTLSRISPQASLTPTTRLAGHLPLWANASQEIGSAAASTPIHLTFLLSRTPALQAAFEQLLDDQQNPAATHYHQWLTPAEIGDQYGPTLDDIAAITQWLASQGIQVTAVSPSRIFLEADTTVANASAAFATTFSLYRVEDQARLAPTTAPAIPTAFAAVIASIEGLAEIPFRSYHTTRLADLPAASPLSGSLEPRATSSSGTHYVFPGDFAKIYDIAATTAAGYDGTGVKVAIAAQSRITASDITELQAMAALPAKTPNTIIIPTSADPGLVKGDEDESTLDVVRVLTTAPGVQADLVIAASSSGGVSSAMQYEINTLLDPILTVSYGSCETSTTASSVQFYNSLFSQAAAEGISVFVSSGDSGAAGCAQAFTTPPATATLAMGNFLCSSSYVTCMGGTEFAEAGQDATFWSPSNSANYVTALGYIPEGVWNEPTVTSSTGTVTYQVAGSGSGPSSFIPKPTWQTGTGVPADNARDTPDLAFTSANHDGYFACLAYIGSAADCSKGGGVIFSGTSATAPSMAAIAALLDQRLGTSQGNLNPLLYRLAASTPAAFHDATPASSGITSCAISTPSLCNNSVASRTALTGGLAGYPLQTGYDLATGLGSLDVTSFLNAASTPLAASTVTLTAPTTSVPAGQSIALTAAVAQGSSTSIPTGSIQFSSTGAFQTSVALTSGSATATAIFPTPGSYTVSAAYCGDANFKPASATPITLTVTAAPTTTTVTASSASLATGASAVFTAHIANGLSTAPTGTVQFYANDNPLGAPVTVQSGTAIYSSTPFSTNGTYAITAVYSGDANNLASTSNAWTLIVAATGSTVTTITVSSSTLTPGTTAQLSAHVIGNTAQLPTGSVHFFANGVSLAPAATLSSAAASIAFSLTTPGTYNLTATYSGDTLNAPSTSAPTAITVLKYSTSATLTASTIAFSTAQTTVAAITLPAAAAAPAPTGSIQLFANGASLGSPIAVTSQTVISPALIFSTPGTYTLTAVYSGDAMYTAATLTGPTLTVILPTIAIASTPGTLSLTSGAATGNTSNLTVSTPNGYTGSVAITCSITTTPSAAANPPTCSLAPSSVTLAGTSATTVLTFATTTPHADTPGTVQASANPYPPVPLGNRLPLALAGLCALFLPRRARRYPLLLLAILLLTPAAILTGCNSALISSGASSTTSSTPVLNGTTAGAYTVTITATPTVGSAVSTTLTLTVQ